MKKLLKIIFYSFIIVILVLNVIKKETIYYIPFDIPGSQMAATIPPFGIFIEKKYEKNIDIINHEKVHWMQYKRMGLFDFYVTYFYEYFKYGRINGPMEIEARKLSKITQYN